MVVGGVDLGLGEAEVTQQIEGGIGQFLGRDAEGALAEFLAQRPLVEDKADVKGRRQGRVDLFQLARAEAMADQRGVVDAGAVAKAAVTHGIGHDLGDLGGGIAQRLKCCRNRLVDDLEVAATGQLLELHQREVGLDPGRVAIHDKADGAGGCDHRGLGIAIAMRLTQAQRLIPGGFRKGDKALIGAVHLIQRDRVDVQRLISRGFAIGGAAVVADHAQHVRGVAGMAREGAKLLGHLGRGGIGHARHQRGQRPAKRAALFAVIAKAHVHQKAADIGIAKAQRAEIIGKLRDLLRGELRHGDRDFQRHGPEPRRMHVGRGVEFAVLVEGQQVHRGQVAGRIIQEHVFRAGVRSPDRAVFRAGVPGVDGVMELDARVGAGPGGVAHLIPQVARLDRLGDLAIRAADQRPVFVILDGVQEGIRHADGVVGILAGNGDVGL